jgi:phosphonate transport system permease protein
MSGRSPFHDSFLANRDRIAEQHGDLLDPGWGSRAVTLAIFGGGAALYVASFFLLDMSLSHLVRGFSRLTDIVGLMFPPTPETWSRFWLYLAAIGQTLSIAFLGTLLAALLAVPIGFLAARNVVANRIVHLLARRSLDTIRSVDTLIWALIWINVVGLGPFAGVLAILCSDFGAFGKLMSEAIETASDKPVEGILSTGGSRFSAIRFGVVPQVLPVFASQVLYYFESNTRSATIIGIVGAGGIGLHLSELIRVLEWQQAAFVILMVLATVAAIDQISQRLRGSIIGRPR